MKYKYELMFKGGGIEAGHCEDVHITEGFVVFDKGPNGYQGVNSNEVHTFYVERDTGEESPPWVEGDNEAA